MSTTSPNFGLIIATTSDTVSVTSHLANNFSTVDALIGMCHTGTGEFKVNLSLTTPTLVNPVISGTCTGGTIIATTGKFNTITATGGIIAVNSLTLGNYTIPSTIGTTGQLLTVSGGNAVWMDNAPGTGADTALSNLASVAINTSLGTFSAGKVTVAQILATSGTLSGLTSIVATTGTFSANLTIAGTVLAGAVNCTGGAITAGGLAIGTYSYPATVGTVGYALVAGASVATWGQVLKAVTYTTNTTFTPASGVSLVFVSMVGGGGGGGPDRGGGGGAGAYIVKQPVVVTPASGHAITVGTGGGQETTGSNTTFVSKYWTMTCFGGAPGVQTGAGGAGGASSGPGYAAAGVVGGGWGITIAGATGTNGPSSNGGGGGGSPFGIGGSGKGAGVAGEAAVGYGAGGGGGGTGVGAAGGSGASGIVYIEW